VSSRSPTNSSFVSIEVLLHSRCGTIRAAIAIPSRRSLDLAAGSATEARYLADVSSRLGYIPKPDAEELVARYAELSAQLQALIAALTPDHGLGLKS
jgi:hypothetical protein